MSRLASRSPSPLSLALAALACGSLAAQTVGPPFQVEVFSNPCHLPAITYSAQNDLWLVVYAIETSATTAELRGQYASGNGLYSFPFVIEATADATVPPVVCSVAETGGFVIGYRRHLTGLPPVIPDLNWYVRTLGIGSASLSNRVPVPSNSITGAVTELVLGGNSSVNPFVPETDALLVVRRDAPIGGSNSIAFAKIDTAGADPVIGSFTTIVAPTTLCGDIALCGKAGDSRWLVAWGQSGNATLPFHSIRAHFVDESGVLCGPLMQLHSGLTAVARPSVAARSTERFAVAWELGSDIRVRTIDSTSPCATGAVTLGATVAPVSAGDNSQPAIVWASNKYVLTWRRMAFGAPSAVLAKALDPASCAACSQEWPLEFDPDGQITPVVASRASVGEDSDEVLIVWSDNDIRARRYEATSTDVVTNLGGGCAGAGLQNVATNDGECVIGNSSFKLVLANPTVPALALIVGFSPLAAPCGSCTIVPSLDILLPGVSPTTLPIPCDPLLIGGNLYAQWMLLKSSTCPILPDFAFTNALRFSIGE